MCVSDNDKGSFSERDQTPAQSFQNWRSDLEWIFFSNLLHFSLAQVKTRIRLTSLSFPYSLSPNFDKTWLTLASNTSRIPMSIGIHLCFLAVLAKQPVDSHSCTYDLFTIMFGIPKVGGKQTNPFFQKLLLSGSLSNPEDFLEISRLKSYTMVAICLTGWFLDSLSAVQTNTPCEKWRQKEQGEERRGEKYRGHEKLQIILLLATATIKSISEHELNWQLILF